MIKYIINTKLKGSRITRKVEVPVDATFAKLHKIIQITMGWQNCHLYNFKLTTQNIEFTEDEESLEEYKFYQSDKGKEYVANLPEEHKRFVAYHYEIKVLDSSQNRVQEYVKKGDKFIYTYDFGDNWEHEISIIDIVENDIPYPVVLAFNGECPPEDVGGIIGYKSLVKILADPNHRDYEEMKEWAGSQGNRIYIIEEVNKKLQKIK